MSVQYIYKFAAVSSVDLVETKFLCYLGDNEWKWWECKVYLRLQPVFNALKCYTIYNFIFFLKIKN